MQFKENPQQARPAAGPNPGAVEQHSGIFNKTLFGSGTIDLLPGITYVARSNQLSWGSQITGVIRTGRNTEGYSLGNLINLTTWSAYKLSPWLSTSLRVLATKTGQINGHDMSIMLPVQTADPTRQGGNKVKGYLGVNMVKGSGLLANHRLGLEFGLPIYQDLNGPQLASAWSLTAGWQYAF